MCGPLSSKKKDGDAYKHVKQHYTIIVIDGEVLKFMHEMMKTNAEQR